MIQHDCGHGACFKRRATNDWVGRVTGVVTLTPYSFWLRGHALHHANAGNLDHRGSGDIMTLTTDEYLALRSLHRLIYRLYRNPFVIRIDSDLSLRAAPTSSFRLDALGKRALAQQDGNQRGDRRRRFFTDLADGGGYVSSCRGSGGDRQRYDRCVVLLRSASIRGYALDSRWRLELSRSGSQWELPL
jgi:hypothetical protein